MRRFAGAALFALAIIAGAGASASAQLGPPAPGGGGAAVTAVTAGGAAAISPLGGFVIGSVAVAAIAPIIGTAVLHRELTYSEVYHMTLSAFLGPVGWIIADRMFPPGQSAHNGRAPHGRGPQRHTPQQGNQGGGRNIAIPAFGATDFVVDEVVLETKAGTSDQQVNAMAAALQLTLLEAQSFGSPATRCNVGASAAAPRCARRCWQYASAFPSSHARIRTGFIAACRTSLPPRPRRPLRRNT